MKASGSASRFHRRYSYLAGAVQRGGGTTCGTILKYNAGHYAKRMNPISQRYCSKVKRELAQA